MFVNKNEDSLLNFSLNLDEDSSDVDIETVTEGTNCIIDLIKISSTYSLSEKTTLESPEATTSKNLNTPITKESTQKSESPSKQHKPTTSKNLNTTPTNNNPKFALRSYSISRSRSRSSAKKFPTPNASPSTPKKALPSSGKKRSASTGKKLTPTQTKSKSIKLSTPTDVTAGIKKVPTSPIKKSPVASTEVDSKPINMPSTSSKKRSVSPVKKEAESTPARKTIDTEDLTCPICQKIFKNACLTRRHIIEVHTLNPYECNACKRTFNRRYAINRHLLKCPQQVQEKNKLNKDK